jgi:hypothetical protein
MLVREVDLATGRELGRLEGKHARWPWVLAPSPDAKLVVTGGEDKRLVLWDRAKRVALETVELEDDFPLSAAWAADGKGIVVGTARGVVLRFAVD